MNDGRYDYAPGSGVRKLAVVGNHDLIGDVGDRFASAAMFSGSPSTE